MPAFLEKEERAIPEHAMTAVELAGFIARKEVSFEHRVDAFARMLLELSEQSAALSRVVGPVARRLLKRLPGEALNSDISRVLC